MWHPWGNKSTVRIHSASSSTSPSSSSCSSFSCSSFKDIQNLCLDEPSPLPSPARSPSPTPKKPSNVFHRVRLANSLIRTWSTHLQQQQQQHQHPPKLPRSNAQSVPPDQPDHVTTKPAQPEPTYSRPPSPSPPIHFPGTEDRVVIYFTSLRVVRRTFEDCKTVLAILRAFRVRLDERDVSMDSGFTGELNRVMGRTGLTLPRVFIGGRYVGGGEVIRMMHEGGELKKALEELPVVDNANQSCHVCAGHRFVVCEVCSGSKKVYTDKAGFKACSNCNENGLVKCPSCFLAPYYDHHEFKN